MNVHKIVLNIITFWILSAPFLLNFLILYNVITIPIKRIIRQKKEVNKWWYLFIVIYFIIYIIMSFIVYRFFPIMLIFIYYGMTNTIGVILSSIIITIEIILCIKDKKKGGKLWILPAIIIIIIFVPYSFLLFIFCILECPLFVLLIIPILILILMTIFNSDWFLKNKKIKEKKDDYNDSFIR